MEELNNEEWCDPAPGRHCNSTIPRLYGFICNMTQGKSDYYNISDNINHTTCKYKDRFWYIYHLIKNKICSYSGLFIYSNDIASAHHCVHSVTTSITDLLQCVASLNFYQIFLCCFS